MGRVRALFCDGSARRSIAELERALFGQRLALTPQPNIALRLIPKSLLGRVAVALGGLASVVGFALPFFPGDRDTAFAATSTVTAPSNATGTAIGSPPGQLSSSPAASGAKINLSFVLTPSDARVVDESGQRLPVIDGPRPDRDEAGFDGTGGTLKAFTLGYAAPEQMVSSGASSGPWTDVYSLALVASEILAGRRVVEAQNPISAMNRLNDPSRRATPRELGANLPRSIEKVFRRALSPETEDRYPDVESFWRAFKAAAPRSALKPSAS